jgi:pilus assembly protein CpaB
VLLTRTVRSAEGGDQSFVDVLLQSIKVLAVDQVADESTESPTVVKAVTLEVSTKDAQKLTLAAGAGQLSLALRQVAANQGENTARITLSDLTGETPETVAARQATQDADRQRNDRQFDGLLKAVEKVDSRLDELSKAKQTPPPAAPQAQEVVKEVVRYLQPEPPSYATVGVIRGVERVTYDVPRVN